MNNKWFVFGALGVAIAIFFLSSQQKDEPNNPEILQESKSSKAGELETPDLSEFFVRPHSPRLGNSMARVTVVEWLDPECEACRAMHPAVKRVIADYGNRINFVVRYMPYHSGSLFAAAALEEARELGKFEEALTVLFENQPEWGNHHKPRPELIPTYLENLGIPLEALQKEKLIAKHGEKIQQDKEDGEKVGVKGTPSFFINEKPLLELGEEQLRFAIDQELERVK